mgnify:CR=1 FL=1
MNKRKIKLLIVDDEKDICKFVKLLFKKRGFSAFSALSGKKAISMAKRIKPDIALIDIYLKKKIDGLKVLSKFREILPKCRCVIVTWDNAEDKVKKAKKLGAVSYLTKPLTTAQLYKVVNQLAQAIRKMKG